MIACIYLKENVYKYKTLLMYKLCFHGYNNLPKARLVPTVASGP